MEQDPVNPIAEDERKLFAGGLPQDIKENEIREHFTKYGEVENIMLKTDQHTGRSRGFCFILFKTTEGLKTVMADPEGSVLKGKKIAIKQAEAKQGKIYVGKLVADLTDDEIKDHFAQYGTVANVEQPFDKIKNERKNFCFITFDKEEVAKKLLKEGSVFVKGHELEIKKVNVKPQNQMGGGPNMYGGMRGGMHAGWGGPGPYGPGGPWGGQDYWGGYGGQDMGYGGYPGYGYGGGYGFQGGYGGPGGKTPRGGAPNRGFMRGGRGGPMQRGAQRQKPY